MTLESLVPSLDLCKQLQAAGFPQDTAMVWFFRDDVLNHYSWVSERVEEIDDSCHVAAPTAGEMDDWLMCNDCDNILVTNETADGENAVGVSCIHSDGRDFEAHEATEIEAKAALVLEVAG
jgi:hypothetical protein